MSKPLIKEIHLLVYPYWSMPPKNVLKRWNSYTDKIKADNSKVLILVKTPTDMVELFKFGYYHGVITVDPEKLHKKEKKLVSKLTKKLGNRFLSCTRDNFKFLVPEFIKNHSFDKSITVVSYGQHANICVKERNNILLGILKKLFPEIVVKNIMLRADSVKSLRETIKYFAGKINPYSKLSKEELDKLEEFARIPGMTAFKLKGFIEAIVGGRKPNNTIKHWKPKNKLRL